MSLLSAFRVEVLLVVMALASLLVGALRRNDSRQLGHWLAAGVFGLFAYSTSTPLESYSTEPGGIFRLDEFALVFKQLCLLATMGVLLIAAESTQRFGRTTSEHYVLILLAATGMLVAITARDFILLFVALELLTTASYVLVGFVRKDPRALEASVKYISVGALSTAFLAYGISYVFGAAGSTSYDVVRQAFAASPDGSTMATLGVTFVVAGVAFKIAVFPGHMWTADVYQGTPLPVTAFLAVASKTTGFAVLLRLLFDPFQPLHAQWAPVVLVVAGITIVWGNLGALQQKDLKRLLGYSSMTHSGYLLLGTVAMSALGAESVIFYLAQYLFTSLACFFVLAALAQNGAGSAIEELRGLSRRAPFLSWGLMASLLSMAGIPPLSGFLAKYMVFSAVPDYSAYETLYFAVLGLALVGVVVSAVYYFGVVRVLWADGPESATSQPSNLVLSTGLAVCVVAMLGLSVYQAPVLEAAARATLGLGLR